MQSYPLAIIVDYFKQSVIFKIICLGNWIDTPPY